MSFPKYPAYKDSGVPFLGAVPAHWDVTRLKFVARVQTGVAKGKDNAEKDTIMVPYLRVANVQDGYFDLTDVAHIEIPGEDLPRYALQAGDVLMNEGGDFDKLGRGHVWDGCISPCIHQNHVFAVRPHGVSSTWLNRITGSAYAQFYFMTRSKQSTNLASISSTNVMELPVVMPPVAEQLLVDAFLDRETAKIDALVAEQEQLITLLKEKRQAIISHAVTKGLDPSVPMKDSGVEWLGEVPEHWTITPIKHLGRLKGGAGFPHSEQGVEGEELCFYKVGALGQSSSNGYLTESENTVSRETACSLGAFIFPKESLVFAKVGAALFLGRVRALPADACLDNNMMGLVVDRERYAPAFIRYAMSLVRFDLIANPGAVPSLNEGQIGNFVLVCPPSKVEQEEIAAFLDRATVQLEDLLAQAESVIATLQERRSALISAAVIGQIDVRGLATAQEQAA